MPGSEIVSRWHDQGFEVLSVAMGERFKKMVPGKIHHAALMQARNYADMGTYADVGTVNSWQLTGSNYAMSGNYTMKVWREATAVVRLERAACGKPIKIREEKKTSSAALALTYSELTPNERELLLVMDPSLAVEWLDSSFELSHWFKTKVGELAWTLGEEGALARRAFRTMGLGRLCSTEGCRETVSSMLKNAKQEYKKNKLSWEWLKPCRLVGREARLDRSAMIGVFGSLSAVGVSVALKDFGGVQNVVAMGGAMLASFSVLCVSMSVLMKTKGASFLRTAGKAHPQWGDGTQALLAKTYPDEMNCGALALWRWMNRDGSFEDDDDAVVRGLALALKMDEFVAKKLSSEAVLHLHMEAPEFTNLVAAHFEAREMREVLGAGVITSKTSKRRL